MIHSVRRWSVVCAALWLLSGAEASAQARPLDRVSLPSAGVRSVALRALGVAIAVRGDSAAKSVSASLRYEGTKSLTGSFIGALNATRSGDEVRIELTRAVTSGGFMVELQVPIGTSLKIDGDNGGLVDVRGVFAAVEVVHSNGPVHLADVRGYAIAATSNGEIRVSLLSVAPDTPMSFITSNGPVELTVPPEFRATLVAPPGVELKSDLPLVADERTDDTRSVRARINGGGPDVRVYTNNAAVWLRRTPKN